LRHATEKKMNYNSSRHPDRFCCVEWAASQNPPRGHVSRRQKLALQQLASLSCTSTPWRQLRPSEDGRCTREFPRVPTRHHRTAGATKTATKQQPPRLRLCISPCSNAISVARRGKSVVTVNGYSQRRPASPIAGLINGASPLHRNFVSPAATSRRIGVPALPATRWSNCKPP